MSANALQRNELEAEEAHSYAHPVSFGKNVRRLRLERDMLAKALAQQLGVKQSTLSGWENDRGGLPEGPTLIKFAKVLGCHVEELLVGVDAEYDEIVIRLRDLSSHGGKTESVLHRGGPVVAASSRIQQLEQQLRERDRLISQAEAAARKTLLVFTTTEENRRAGAHQSRSRGARRKTG